VEKIKDMTNKKVEENKVEELETTNEYKISFKTPFQYIVFSLKKHKGWVFLIVFLAIVFSLFDKGVIYLSKLIVDNIELGERETAVWLILFFPIGVFLIQVLQRSVNTLMSYIAASIRKQSFDFWINHLLKHSQNFFINRFSGSISSKIRNVVFGAESIFSEFIWVMVLGISDLLVMFVLVYSVDEKMAFIFLGLVVVVGAVDKYLTPFVRKAAKEYSKSNSAYIAGESDVVINISSVKLFTKEGFELERLRGLSEKMKKAKFVRDFLGDGVFIINSFILVLANFWIFKILVDKWETGLVSTGDIVLVIGLTQSLSFSVMYVGRVFRIISETLGNIEEGLDDLLVPFEIVDKKDAKELEVKKGEIKFSNMTFSYNKNKLFSDFNLFIKSGQRVGLVGRSGAGKTSLTSILLRQQIVEKGQVTIDGQDISDVTLKSLNQVVSLVPQDPLLFHRSIGENIAYGKECASEEEIIKVAKDAQIHDFISSLPDGYKTLVGERGVKLSGGQRQRISIARAMLKNSPILILDEATSALDSENEIKIQRALHALMRGKTVISIAHRLSTLREMDRIVVLEKGEIVEDGTHESLKDNGGIYESLWKKQVNGFATDSNSE